MKFAPVIFQICIGLLIAGGAGVLCYIFFLTAPKTRPEDKKPVAKIVQTVVLEPGNERITVTAFGVVIPAREVKMQPQVSGRIVSQNESLVPGGRLSSGDELVRIDREDYELALTEKMAELEQAKFDFEVESGRQTVARREWQQLQRDIPGADLNSSLALRKPHLKLSEAMVAKAQNAINRAELDLSRTILTAPFNSMVVEESVEVGQLVEPGSEICHLVGTDSFWVRVTLPAAELKRIRVPQGDRDGAVADILLDTGHGDPEIVHGKVVRLLADLEEDGRLARVLVEVEDPLQLKKSADGPKDATPLLLGSYVQVNIEAGRLTDVLTIPRSALREGNRLWLVGADKRIRIADPEILWTRPETVLVPNILKDGERLIVSELKSALPGMLVNPQPLKRAETGSKPTK
ncbi:MAG: efflux RND transporter periplasmic adaptor subunit [Verrucomicrobiales bacterium]|nr:efflux RND transporter periplasmic adaptor subunit [Verrucomicrobiales bacterium]